MKLLNKIPVLDKGSVALYASAPVGEEFAYILKTHFRGSIDNRITNMTYIIMSIRCPLFVQLTFSEQGLLCSSEKTSAILEAYIPDISEIGASDLETSTVIQLDIAQTTEALLLNPTSYQQDNCDIFVSQVISPISVYNTIMVYGTLTSWMQYVEQKAMPKPIEAYRNAIEKCIHGEYTQVAQAARERNAKKK